MFKNTFRVFFASGAGTATTSGTATLFNIYAPEYGI